MAIFYNTLVLSDEKLVDDDYFKKLELRNDEKNLKPWEGERSYASVLKSRDFRNADFSNIDLRKADLSNSVFDNAGLVSASLQGASLNMASLQGALLNGASLQGASLNEASLQGAVLFGTSLQGASLDMASLQGAVLTTSLLQGASLQSTKLQGASLDQVSLQGASLKHAWLQGASLNMALLQGTSLDWATLDGATLFRANLQGASLDGASLQATLIQEASVWRSSGRPFKGLAVAVHINTSRLQTESFETLLADALRGVPRFAVAKIRSSIAQLNPNVPDPQKMFDWSKILREMEDTPNFSDQVIESLTETACEAEAAPVVAQGIVKVRLYFQDDARMEVLPLIEMLLTGCPGTTGMDQSYFDLLNAMKAEYTSILKYK